MSSHPSIPLGRRNGHANEWARGLRRACTSVLPALMLAACASAPPTTTMSAGDATIQAALQRVEAQCPADYPTTVTPIPGDDAMAALSTAQLIEMMGSWSPAMREAAANGLATRGDEVVPALKKAAASDDPHQRAGAAAALAAVVRHQFRHWPQAYPDITDAKLAHEKIKTKYAGLTPLFVRMTKDPQRSVRAAAMSGLAGLRPDTLEAKRAMLALCADPDDYIADTAINIFQKVFTTEGLSDSEVRAALGHTFSASLPRGKGHAIMILQGMDEPSKRAMIPQLLHHLDWQPMRDTMFGASGQAAALEMLTAMRVKEVIRRIPKLMVKTMRGPGLFEPGLASMRAFGRDSLVIVPELEAYAQKLEDSLPQAHPRHRDGIKKKVQQIREAIAYVESL